MTSNSRWPSLNSRHAAAPLGRLLVEQALVHQALQNMVNGGALELDGLRQRQRRTIVVLAGGGEDDER